MDIQKEEFLEWVKSENPLLVDEAESGSQFHKDILDYMFMGWVAKAQKQAIPEGFVLVPREMSDDLNDQLWDFITDNFVNTNEDGDSFIECADFDLEMFYKSIIETQESTND